MSETTDPGSQAAAPAEAVSSTPSGEGRSPEQAVDAAGTALAPAAEDTGDEPDGDKTPAWAKKALFEQREARRRAERDAEHWRELAMRQAPQAPPPAQQANQPTALPPDLAQYVGAEPKPADFAAGEWDPEYNRAIARHEVKAAQATAELQRRQHTHQQQQQEFQRRAHSMMDEAIAMDPRVADVMADKHFPMPQHVVVALMEGDKPAAVLAHLTAHPEEAARIAGLRPLSAARALERIEAKLTAAPPPPPVSAAPPPPRTLRGGSASNAPDLSRMSMDEYARWRSQ